MWSILTDDDSEQLATGVSISHWKDVGSLIGNDP